MPPHVLTILCPSQGELGERDKEILSRVEKSFTVVAELIEAVSLRDALKEAMSVVRDVNKYLDDKAPWTQFKEDKQAAGTTIFVAFCVIDSLKTILSPFLPESSEKLQAVFQREEKLFGKLEIESAEDEEDVFDVLTYQPLFTEQFGVDRWRPSDLQPGSKFVRPEPLFSLIDEKEVLE